MLIRTANIDVLKEAFACDEKVADDGIYHQAGCWRHFIVRKKCLLGSPFLQSRIFDWRLADKVPANSASFPCENLHVEPGILVGVEELITNVNLDIHDGNREYRHENVSIPASGENFLGKGNISQGCSLLLAGIHHKDATCLLNTKEVLAHYFAGALLRE